MNSNKAEYGVQPAYNQSLLPSCPPSYSEAVASSFRFEPSAIQLPYPKQPDLNQAVNPGPQVAHVQVLQHPSYVAPAVTLPPVVGPRSVHLHCPHCHAYVRTNIKSGVQKSAHYACFFLCLFGCFLCSCIPYCLASFKNVHHYCPECNGFIGTYRA